MKSNKPVVIEPSEGGSRAFEETKAEYRAFCNRDRRKGAILFAVFRGKMSEGISFNDHYARGVICVGIPYPNAMDVQVKRKKQYNDLMSRFVDATVPMGDTWYDQQAFRALNQALGRCIRHVNDYGK